MALNNNYLGRGLLAAAITAYSILPLGGCATVYKNQPHASEGTTFKREWTPLEIAAEIVFLPITLPVRAIQAIAGD